MTVSGAQAVGRKGVKIATAAVAVGMLAASSAAFGQTKIDGLLEKYGLPVQAVVDPNGAFFYSTHTVNGQQVDGFVQANYSAPQWTSQGRFTDSNGQPIPGAWSTWSLGNDPLPDQIPVTAAHLSDLRTLQIGDEENWLTDPTIRARYVSRFQQAESNPAYDHTILYTNNFLGQLQLDEPDVTSFIQQAHPDMLTFDNYPYNVNNPNVTDDSQILNTPFDSWYTEMRFYRDVTMKNGIVWGAYRQVYATTSDSPATRPPSATEYGVQTMSALAFNAKFLSDFIYNGSASRLFTDTNQTATTDFYRTVQHVNTEARNLGKSLAGLSPLYQNQDLNWAAGTPDILFLRGQQVTASGTSSPLTSNALPNGFQPNGVNGGTYSTWNKGANDPWLAGFAVANVGKTVGAYTTNTGAQGYARGDALVSWFKPISMTQADAAASGDIYFMVTNLLSTPNATPEQCLQNIQLNFDSVPLDASGNQVKSIQVLDPTTGEVNVINLTAGLTKLTDVLPGGTVVVNPTGTNASINDPINTNNRLRVTIFLNGGDALLFKFNTGDAFVVPEPSTVALFGGVAAMGVLKRRRRRA